MKILPAQWQAPKQVVAFSTTRSGGVSKPPFNSLNLGLHVGDNSDDVFKNRALLSAHLALKPIFLNQIHSNRVIEVTSATDFDTVMTADALYTRHVELPLAIMTADCLPIFISSRLGDEVAVIHAGWRGLLNGVVENTLMCFKSEQLVVYLGPAISAKAFEVGAEVRDAFVHYNEQAAHCFRLSKTRSDKYMADLYGLATLKITQSGVTDISGGQHCTYRQDDQFFSYRRDGVTGRNAHIIYIQSL